MARDRQEANNLVEKKPNIVANLTQLLETAITNGRTTTGSKQQNDVKVVIWKDQIKAINLSTQN